MRGVVAGLVLIAAATVASDVRVRAQGFEAGAHEYLSNCAACHGVDGKGRGPRSAALRVRPADLTRLARRNNGVFSAAAVHAMVDGRTASHRGLEMPIWGCRQSPPQTVLPPPTRMIFRPRKRAQRHKPRTPPSILDLACDPEPVIRRRIDSVVEFLRGIQER